MSDFEIRRGVPVPAITRDSKYPWADMEDGDSIVFPSDTATGAATSARSWVSRHRPDLSVVTRTFEDGAVGIWFIAQEGEGEDVGEEA